MTVYHLDEIAGDVRIALDQNTTSDVLKEIGDVDTVYRVLPGGKFDVYSF